MNGRIVVRRVACIAALTCLSGAWGWGQTIPRDRQAIPAVPPQTPVRDRPPTPKTGNSAIKGRIVDGVTGKPIARARVRLSGMGVNRGPVLTDATGTFVFDKLAAGGYRVMADKSTYISGMYPDSSRSIRSRFQQLVVADHQVLDDVTIMLYHSAAIAGRVVDAYGDPIEGAMVSVMMPQRGAGGRGGMRGSTQTNDLGEFRVSRLTAGRYLLFVRVQPTFYPPDNSPALDPPIPLSVPTFYPGTPSIDEARPIVLNRGESVTGIDLAIGEGMPTIVTGMVVSTDGQPVANGNISARIASSEAFSGFENNTALRADGSFRVPLTPGEYVLEARSFPRQTPGEPPRPENEQYGTARITVTGAASDSIVIMLGRGATASGQVVFEGNTPPPQPPPTYSLPLYNPSGPGCRPARVTIAPDWTFKVDGLSGTCGVPPGGMFGRWTVKAVNVRGQNVIDRMMTFESGQSYGNVTIVVTDKRTQVEIGVTDESGQITHDYAALVFPADKDRWGQLARYVRTAAPTPPQILQAQRAMLSSATPLSGRGAPPPPPLPDSRSHISRMFNLPLGEYYAIAFDDMDPEDTMEPNVLEKLIPSATKITVAEDATVDVTLRRFRFSDVIR